MTPRDAVPPGPAAAPAAPVEQGRGILYAVSAYVLWGFMPLYFLVLAPTGPFEVVSWRVIFSFVFCAILIAATGLWPKLRTILRTPRLLLWTAVAGLLIYVNWQVFLLATLTGHVIETSLGYFINPLVTVLLGVVVLRERLRPTQWVAIGLAGVAVLVLVIGYRSLPWMSLVLAFSFGTYGLVKKRIGPSVDAVSGLTLESLWLLPIAVVQLGVVAATTGLTMGTAGGWHVALLASAGVVTAVPLLLFAAGARRIPLSVVGLLQFIAPIMQFVIGWAVLGEPMPLERWIGFAIVWAALVVLTVDSVIATGRARRRARR